MKKLNVNIEGCEPFCIEASEPDLATLLVGYFMIIYPDSPEKEAHLLFSLRRLFSGKINFFWVGEYLISNVTK